MEAIKKAVPDAALSAAEPVQTTTDGHNRLQAVDNIKPVAWVYAADLEKGDGCFGNAKGEVCMSRDGEWINVDTPLYAAPPAPSVAVKTLEWKGPTPETNGCHVAETIFGTYSAVNEDGWYVTLDDHPWGQGFEWSAPDMRMTFDDAAKAAQADYEARIRSALSAQVQDESEIIECLLSGKPFVFDPATNFCHADDGGAPEHGIKYVPAAQVQDVATPPIRLPTALSLMIEKGVDPEQNGYCRVIDVEKFLCAKLGREWSATGMSIVSLVEELSAAPAKQEG
ncbi:hypothetical protein [Agrobacterium pusense]|uniref:hypothetical protein n=1 Tax=Agrobacterium pusense TaxID=648995 RepID=UPI000AFB6E28|nr:hypothetical protein [Agrobacterium pusense]QWW74122.1 hypothetical protein KP800_01020 [Agrobacterium pusense]